MGLHQVLIDGCWRDAEATGSFRACNPQAGEELRDRFPVSAWSDVEAAVDAGRRAAAEMGRLPDSAVALFLEAFARRLDHRTADIAHTASLETALPVSPRLADVEMARTTGQLRQAAAAVREGSWRRPTIDAATNIRSIHEPLSGPVVVFGPNNFPLAFNSVSGGDFAAAMAAGNPVIAKANTSHPATTELLAREAFEAVREAALPPAAVQLLYRISHRDGERLVAHPGVGATAYTGSRAAGLLLKAAADRAGKPIYLELSAMNPVFVMPGALAARGGEIAEELVSSCLLGTGQFCTRPGLTVISQGPFASAFLEQVRQLLEERPAGTLLSHRVRERLARSVGTLAEYGVEVRTGGALLPPPRPAFANTLLHLPGDRFLEEPARFQTETFGNVVFVVTAQGPEQMVRIAEHLEGSLTGAIYSALDGSDDREVDRLAPVLLPRVGRYLNDKMPTGVAVVPSMNHGGPYPATGHPGFTAVGMPAAILRFSALRCYDNVRPHRLPRQLRDKTDVNHPLSHPPDATCDDG